MSEHEDEKFWRNKLDVEIHDGSMFDVLEKFFQDRRDQELGRWRWPKNPNFVVYQREAESHTGSDYQECAVVNEADGYYQSFGSDLPACHGGEYREAARAYFAAHPVSKPWHDAKPGEVWLLTFDGGQPRPVGVFDFGGTPHFSVPGAEDFSINYARITASRRIWLEVPNG